MGAGAPCRAIALPSAADAQALPMPDSERFGRRPKCVQQDNSAVERPLLRC